MSGHFFLEGIHLQYHCILCYLGRKYCCKYLGWATLSEVAWQWIDSCGADSLDKKHCQGKTQEIGEEQDP